MKTALTTRGRRTVSAVVFLLATALFGLPAHADDSLPVVNVLSGSGITEGGTASFWLIASPPPATPLTVSVNIGETGSFLAPGQAGRRPVTIPAAPRTQVRFTVRTTDDGRNEAPGSVDVTVNPGSGYRLPDSAHSDYRSASVAVADNDRPVITIGVGSKIGEGGTARFTLSASPRPAAPIDVSVTVTQKGEFASQGQTGDRTVTVGTNGRGTLDVATDSDTTDEDDGFITAKLVSSQDQKYAVGSPGSARVDVTDGGAPTPRISVRATSSAIVEGGTASFELTASPRPATPLNVRVDITDSGSFARQGEAGTRIVTIGTSGRATIDVETENDLVSEPDGSLTATVLGDTGYLVTASGRASVAVRDESIEVRISSAGDIVEGGTATFTLTAHPAPPESLVVTVGITENGSFLLDGTHEQLITVGTDGRGTLSVDTTDDERVEADGAIVATVQSGYGYAPGSPARATARVSDATPTITIAAGSSVVEGDTATFALKARPAPVHNLTVRLDVTEIAGGTFAPSGELGPRDATIYTDGTGTLEVRTDDDEQDEGSGTITARILSDSDGYYRIGSPRSATLQVNDDDHDRNELTVSVGDASVREGQRFEYGRRIITFPVTLSKPANHSVRVYFQTRPHEGAASPATPDVDYRATHRYSRYGLRRSAWFPPGTTERSVTVEIYDDDEYEPDPETFELVISQVYGAEIADGRAIGTIEPDPSDAPRGTPVVTIAASGAVEEGQRVTFKLKAEPAPAEDLVVQVRVYDESLGAPASDYLAEDDEGLHDVTIPGVGKRLFQYYKDSLASFTLRTVDDAEEEAGGKISVQIESAADGSYDTSQEPYYAEVGVRDNDGPPLSVRPAIRIADATANESDGSILFDVTLDPAVPYGAGPMTVDYMTYPGTAGWNVDFDAKRGTLTFYEGESVKQIEVEILEDQHDEGEESFYVYLRNARGGARIADYRARGTIVNSDPMPAAWLARFGRTVAEQALEGVAGRLEAARTPGMRGTLAGQALVLGPGDPMTDRDAVPVLSDIARRFDGAGHRIGAAYTGEPQTLSGLEALQGSSFTLTGEQDAHGGSAAFWGRGSHGTFEGMEGEAPLDGEVTTGMLGADYAGDRWLLGLALAQSKGEGDYRGTTTGKVESSLTAAIPYASLRASERLKLWGAFGYGTGDVTDTPNGGNAMKADIDWTMAALGMRGDVLAPPEEGAGPALAIVSDAFSAQTSSERSADFVATESDATRLRLGLEGSWRMVLEGGGTLTPKLVLSARHDDGDAETGFGMELGGGLAWADSALGLSFDIEGRTLLSHDDETLEDRGMSASLAFDPDPASARGPSFSLRQDIGGRTSGGLDALFASDPLATDRTGGGAAGRWQAEAAWGFAAFDGRFVGSPHVGLGLATDARDYSLGWRLAPAKGAPDLSVGVKATRRESDDARPVHGIGVEIETRW